MISYADGDGDEEDSLKIRSGRRRHDEVTCGKFGRVYSHGEFVPPCILCISSGGSFRSSENQEITEKVERGNMCTNEQDKETKKDREKERQERATKYYHLAGKVPKSKFRGELSRNWFLFVTRSLARLRRHRRRRARPN